MPKRSHPQRAARRGAAQPVTTVRSPADTLALVPYLFGFTPHESLVVISLTGPRQRFGPTFRLDLPPPEHRTLLTCQVLDLVRRHRYRSVLVAVFSAEPERADPWIAQVLDGLDDAGVRVAGAFRGDGSRWWSYLCDDPTCCGPDGTAYDVQASPAAADAVLAGLAKAPDREALRAQFEPDDGTSRQAVAVALAELRNGERARGPVAAPMTVPEVRRLIPLLLSGLELSAGEQALLLLSLLEVQVRDEVWGSMRRETAAQHLEVWSALTRVAPDDLLAPVGSLAAFAAWLRGSGVLAAHAVERVLDVHPDYSMARLLQRALDGAVDPRTWTFEDP